jgi:hypothetical protein
VVRDPRLKQIGCLLTLFCTFRKDASANAILPFLFRKGYDGCSNYTELNQKLNVFTAQFVYRCTKVGRFSNSNLSISSIDDALHWKRGDFKEAADILCG